jgi:type IV secretion system protein VirB10
VKLFRGHAVPAAPRDDGVTADASSTAPAENPAGVEGERGIPSVNRVRSVQSRVSSALAITLMSVLAGGLLIWYYAGAITRRSHAQDLAQASQKRRAEGDTTLPSLGAIHPPRTLPAANDSTVERLLGAPPPTPVTAPEIPLAAGNPYAMSPSSTPAGPAPKTPAELALDRRLAGPVLGVLAAESAPGAVGTGGTDVANAMSVTSDAPPSAGLSLGSDSPRPGGSSGPMSLGSLLRPTATPAVSARVLPTQRFLLPKGAFIDCTLETAINSSLPGMTTCVTATDTFSADGSVVLMERGTKLVGETRGQVQQGSPRLFVLWNEARTPTGVVVPLASPGTDELGRSGLSGAIDWHWWQRFGEAILITVIDGAVQAASQSNGGNGSTFVYNPSATSQLTTEVLKGTLDIAPTIDKPQGDRIQILVARDVDFRSVYALRASPVADR